jgi:hypothetical protein
MFEENISNYNLDEIVVLDNKLRKFLKFRSTEIKYNIVLNYFLCNYVDDIINFATKERTFFLRKNIKSFLINEKKYNGDDYNIDGIKLLLNNFISKRKILIKI